MSLSDFEPDELEGLQQKWPRIVGAMLDAERTIETQAAEIERLRASLAEAVGVLRHWQVRGCPDCNGDCASANPPVVDCLPRETADFITKHGGERE